MSWWQWVLLVVAASSSVYHLADSDGTTDCGKDATKEHWLWPM